MTTKEYYEVWKVSKALWLKSGATINQSQNSYNEKFQRIEQMLEVIKMQIHTVILKL